MRLTFLIFTVFLLSTFAHARAKNISSASFPSEGSIGAGAMVGTIGSVSAKYFLTNFDALDLGVEILDHPLAVFYADYYRHFIGLLGKGSRFARETSLYAGAGAGIGFWDRTDNCGRWHCHWNTSPSASGTGTGFFLRLVAGLEWYPRLTHFSVFGEVGPSFMWYPSGANTIDVSVGGRYYF